MRLSDRDCFYKTAQDNCGLCRGDKVLVSRKATQGEKNWPASWIYMMDPYVEKICTIRAFDPYGVYLEECPGDWVFPYFILVPDKSLDNQYNLQLDV